MTKRILMVAAENDALPGGKVGGIGDVIRDLPHALTNEGLAVDVVIPSYGFLARLDNLEEVGRYSVHFAGFPQQVILHRVTGQSSEVNNYIVDHPGFAPQGEKIYCDDPDWQPFATDATKFALFCAAVAQALKDGILPFPDVLHCHDWHTAFLLVLRQYSTSFKKLKTIPAIFTIHNLAMQGIRPLKGDASSLESWYPDLPYDGRIISDPDNPHCINPMRAAILLADKVHTVSQTYAKEIQLPGNHKKGIYGGEGLEADLGGRADDGALIGILNGSEYPAGQRYTKPTRKKIASLVENELLAWAGKDRYLRSAHWIAEKRLAHWMKYKGDTFTTTYVGRITDQKVRLFQTRLRGGKTVLEAILTRLQAIKSQEGETIGGYMLWLGSGNEQLESFFAATAGRFENFIYLNGYSDALSHMVYCYGDLFLMPSSFEPCGISQMLAMRAGQPCLVNGVGGLKDTVRDNENGFVFSGPDIQHQAQAMLDKFDEAINLFLTDKTSWESIRQIAGRSRFTWRDTAIQYIKQLYT